VPSASTAPRLSRDTRIRAITAGLTAANVEPGALARRLSAFFQHAESSFTRAGYEVHTRRLTLPPAAALAGETRFSVWNRLQTVTRAAEAAGVRWTCQPFLADSSAHAAEWRLAAVETIRRFPRTFVNFIVADAGGIYRQALPEVAQAITDIAGLTATGFDNFRVGAGCNLNPNTPFFPFSFHEGADGFSLAVEIIETAIATLESAPEAPLEEKREAVVEALSAVTREIDAIGRGIEAATDFAYKGLDISLAPFPDKRRSLAVLFRLIGLEAPGHAGTMAVTSFFTNILKTVIKRTGARAAGFNGVMFSPLEDTGLAAAGNDRLLTLEKLLGWSTVCGCGIDMVPIAGDVMREEIAALMLDTAAVSTVLRKPLGIRVLPIPGAKVNELTSFNHDFLVNTRIYSLSGQTLPLAGGSGPFRYLAP
jgi:uncharacterized protein (UPF0210 family)